MVASSRNITFGNSLRTLYFSLYTDNPSWIRCFKLLPPCRCSKNESLNWKLQNCFWTSGLIASKWRERGRSDYSYTPHITKLIVKNVNQSLSTHCYCQTILILTTVGARPWAYFTHFSVFAVIRLLSKTPAACTFVFANTSYVLCKNQ